MTDVHTLTQLQFKLNVLEHFNILLTNDPCHYMPLPTPDRMLLHLLLTLDLTVQWQLSV